MRTKAKADPRYNGRMYDWEIIRKFPRGYSYFRDLRSGRVGIAGGSGRKPHTTEDGVLWLDTSGKCNIIGPHPVRGSHSFLIPLLDVEQQKTGTRVDVVEAAWLSARYKLKIKLLLGHGEFFTVSCRIEGIF